LIKDIELHLSLITNYLHIAQRLSVDSQGYERYFGDQFYKLFRLTYRLREGGVLSMSTIQIFIDERFPAEKAIKKFKRMCDAYGIVKEYRARSEYRKPSVKMKEKLENADKRRRKNDTRFTRTKY
jgi:small subunit ribosomal protein S21